MAYAQGNATQESSRLQNAAGASEPSDRPPPAIRIAFVGRRSTAERMEGLFSHDQAAVRPETDAVAPLPRDAPGHSLTDGIAVTVLTNQKAALRLLRTDPPRVLLVEVDARPDSRQRFCQTLRSRAPALAIFGVGAEPPQGSFTFDGFLPLPLTRERVAAAIEGIRAQSGSQVLQRGPFRLNVATRTVYTPRGSRHMTPKQCALLELLMTHHNEVVCRSDIMAAIWETSYLDDTRTLDVHIRWLRESIEPDPSSPLYLLTVRGQGYTFQTPDRAALP